MMETTESVEDWDVEMIRGIFFCFFYEFLGQTEVDAETQEPLPQLTAPCRDWCRAAGGLARAERVDASRRAPARVERRASTLRVASRRAASSPSRGVVAAVVARREKATETTSGACRDRRVAKNTI